jgi:hypothetical protein
MSIRVFYSWQSDTDGLANHYLIRDALEAALRQTTASYDLQERPLLDHDTKGVPGTPPIFSTILSKIEQCSIFVADVTFIAQTGAGRSTPNPNVLIELGYAMKVLGSERYLLVMNENYGAAKGNLPFDLDHLRWPIRYSLDPTERAKVKEVKEQLTLQFARAIQVVLESGVLENQSSTSTTLTADRALFAEFLQEFPSSGRSAYFLRNHDLGDSFDKEELSEIDHFLYYWNDAQHEFFDKQLEQNRLVLYRTLRRFTTELARSVLPTRNPQRYSIGMSDGEMRPQIFDLRESLNALATEAYERHQELVRAGRRMLGHAPVASSVRG